MSLQKSKSDLRIRRRDTSPFLDAALEFLFAIVEHEVRKKEPTYLVPNIHEFYSLSLHIQLRKTRSNRTKPTISPSLLKLLQFVLNTKLAYIKTSKGQFTTCLQVVVVALFAYSEFLQCMDAEVKTIDSIHIAMSWYFSHYFLPIRREAFLAILKHQIFEKRTSLLHTFIPCTPCLSRVVPCIRGMQHYFQSSEFQNNILPALFQCLQ